MQQRLPFRPFYLVFSIAVVITMLLTASHISQAQSPSATPTGTAATNDDSNELPIYINVIGYVQTITATSIQINGQTLIIPAGMTLPGDVAVNKVVSIHGNLLNDDSILIMVIVSGYHLPTSTPVSTANATTIASESPTAAASATAQSTVQGTAPAIGTESAECSKPGQKLALVVSAAYAVPYNQVVELHCKGYAYGVIARSYLIMVSAEDEGRPTTVDVVLSLRARGNHWSVIIVILNVHPDVTIIVFVINGGKAQITIECGDKEHHKKSKLCTISSGGRGGGGGDDDHDDRD